MAEYVTSKWMYVFESICVEKTKQKQHVAIFILLKLPSVKYG